MAEGDKARMLIESMDRLTISINRFVTILNDAQKDIIDEYQESKPVEKLNQLLEQNETIAKVLISMNDNMKNSSSSSDSRNPLPSTPNDYSTQGYSQQPIQNQSSTANYSSPTGPQPAYAQQQPVQNYSSLQPTQQAYSQQPIPNYSPAYNQQNSFNNMPPIMQQNSGMMNDPRNPLPIPIPPSMGSGNNNSSNMNQQPMSFNPSMSMNSQSMSMNDDFPPMDDMPPLDVPKPSAPKKKFLGIM
jgi:hypothetical protein